MSSVKPTKSVGGKTKVISIRIRSTDHAMLVRVAKSAGVSMSGLARVLIDYGLSELMAGNKHVKRAIKTSRDS